MISSKEKWYNIKTVRWDFDEFFSIYIRQQFFSLCHFCSFKIFPTMRWTDQVSKVFGIYISAALHAAQDCEEWGAWFIKGIEEVSQF